MPFYKDLSGKIHDLSDAKFEYMLPKGCIHITDEEAAELQAIPQKTLDDYKAEQLLILADECKEYIYKGFSSNALGKPYHYPFKALDQSNLDSSVIASMLPGVPEDWTTSFWCMDDKGNWAFVPHTAVQIQTVGMDAMAAKLAAITRNHDLENQVAAATTIDEVKFIHWK